ncbi:uncharacterized protein F4822DRAFT_445456 [Hypoxylon trugodes]|uniref:uncharacterized protein n=1 Tax=Hypoxylon trugodes TaxID=326681 RepID=UPI00218DA0C8|nr:uncharacterized protein F4822DRAFT_445456 [Hypoxylon trugodes]KAI1385511.1 hypothetical protein F4822DRAFT_445456 [Hypoxylon trugodes]
MHILRQATSTGTGASPTGSSLPAACYDPCNNAYLEYQRVGKNSSTLCASGSAFQSYVGACKSCIGDANLDNSNLKSILEYCDAVDPASSISSTPGATATASSDSVRYTTLSTVSPSTFLTNLDIVSDGVTMTWWQSIQLTVFAPIPSTGIIESTATANGETHVVTFTTTFAQLPSGLTEAIISGTTSTTSTSGPPSNTPSPAAPGPEQTQVSSRAWIAGPVVGSVAGVLLIALGGLFLWRRGRKQRQIRTDNELHGNTVKTEMDAPNRPQELDTASIRAAQPTSPQELAADGR